MGEYTIAILNTRPQGQGDALTQLVETHQIQSFPCPLIRIESLKSPSALPRALEDFDAWIFISVNAVTAFQEHLAKLNRPCSNPAYAIGKATATALHKIGLQTVTAETPFDSERLVRTLDQTSLKHALIVKGEGGRDLLTKALSRNGTQVTEWPLYRRVPAPFCSEQWRSFKAVTHPVLLFTSDQAWQFFKRQISTHFRSDWPWVCNQDCIVFSERIAKSLHQDGMTGCISVVNEPSNEGILKCLNEFRQKNR